MTKSEPGFTPHSIRQRWTAFKHHLEGVAERSLHKTGAGFAAISLLTVLNYFLIFKLAPTKNIYFIPMSSFQALWLGLCVWGPLGLLLRSRNFPRGAFMAGGLWLHSVAVVLFFGWRAPLADNLLQILLMIIQPCLAYFICAASANWPPWTAWLTSMIIAAVSYWVFFAAQPVSPAAWISLRANPARYVMFMTFYALQFHYLKLRFKNRDESWSYFFNPTQTLIPLPLAAEGFQQPATARTYAQGLINLAFATIALALYLPLTQVSGPGAGYLHHFFYLFFLIACPVGLLQWCGFPVPQPADFALLSASPHLRWRRWNRYTYKWLSLTVFFPLLKRTGSRLAALIISFLCVGLLHLNALLFISIPGSIRTQVFKLFCYYLGHGAAIWIGFLLPESWTDERRHSSWLGVAVTWIMVTCIFSLYY